MGCGLKFAGRHAAIAMADRVWPQHVLDELDVVAADGRRERCLQSLSARDAALLYDPVLVDGVAYIHEVLGRI